MLLEKKLAIASYTKALEFRNDKCFRRVTEEGYDARSPDNWQGRTATVGILDKLGCALFTGV